MKRYIHTAVSPWKVRYEVHWVSPDGKDCLLGGSKSLEEAQRIAKEQAKEIFESPFESNERKFHFLNELYIWDVENDEEAMLLDTEEYIDNLVSEIDSRIKKPVTSSEEVDDLGVSNVESSTEVEQIPEILESRPYTVSLTSVNSTYNDDILYLAEQHGAIKVKYGEYSPKGNYIPVQNGFWRYAVDSADTLEAILEDIKSNMIPLANPHPSLFETDWSNKYQIRIDDYDMGMQSIDYHNYRPSNNKK